MRETFQIKFKCLITYNAPVKVFGQWQLFTFFIGFTRFSSLDSLNWHSHIYVEGCAESCLALPFLQPSLKDAPEVRFDIMWLWIPDCLVGKIWLFMVNSASYHYGKEEGKKFTQKKGFGKNSEAISLSTFQFLLTGKQKLAGGKLMWVICSPEDNDTSV